LKNLVLAMNLQRAYFDPDGSCYLGESSEVVLARILDYIKNLDLNKYDVIYTRDIRNMEDPFFKDRNSSCFVGTLDVDPLSIFVPYTKERINTSRPSAMYKTPLETEIKKRGYRSIYIIGAETHSSVCLTAADLRYRNYEVFVPEPLVTSRDEYLHGAGITMLTSELGVNVTAF